MTGFSRTWWLASAVALTVAACSSSPSPGAGPSPASSAETLNVFTGGSDYAVGENRFSFFLADNDGRPLEDMSAEVAFGPVHQDNKITARSVFPATYKRVVTQFPHTHEGGQVHLHEDARGYYLVERAPFDAPGPWAALVTVGDRQGKALSASAAFQVRPRAATPAVGEAVPATSHPTAADVRDLAEIDSSVPPRPQLHQVSVAQALERKRAFVVVFATPAFCTSRLCGPVTEEVAALQPRYGEAVDFIHIEPYELGPLRREGAFRLAPPTREWNLPTEPWVFIVSKDGRLAAKFEGLVSADELESALRRLPG